MCHTVVVEGNGGSAEPGAEKRAYQVTHTTPTCTLPSDPHPSFPFHET